MVCKVGHFNLTNESQVSIEIVFEPEGMDFSLEPGSKLKVDFKNVINFIEDIVFADGFIEIYSTCSYDIYINDRKEHSFGE